MLKFFAGVAVGATLMGYAWWYKTTEDKFDDQN